MASPISHVQLRVADLERSLTFYRDLLGFRIIRDDGRTLHLSPRAPEHLSTGAPEHPSTGAPEHPSTGAPEHLTLREVSGLARRPRQPRTAGLYHVAWLVPSRADLGRALLGLSDARYPLTGAADHTVSESLYLDDPDGNGVEIYADRPREGWIWANDRVHMTVDPMQVDDVVRAAGKVEGKWAGLPSGTMIGHVHFTVSELAPAVAHAQKQLGMDVTFVMPTLVGLAVDRYHHHVNLNTWAGEGAPPDDPMQAGLDEWTWKGMKGLGN